MPHRPGQPSKSFIDGNIDQYNFKNNRELASKAGKKSAQLRKERNEQKKKMKDNLAMLLELDVKDDKYKTVMSKMGLTTEDMTNQMLLMVSLFKKGLTGDVAAIRQISDMMDEYGLSKKETENESIMINIYPKTRAEIQIARGHKPQEEQEEFESDNASVWGEEVEDDWPDDEIEEEPEEWPDDEEWEE